MKTKKSVNKKLRSQIKDLQNVIQNNSVLFDTAIGKFCDELNGCKGTITALEESNKELERVVSELGKDSAKFRSLYAHFYAIYKEFVDVQPAA